MCGIAHFIGMADAFEHGAEFLPFLAFEAEHDEQALGDLERPVEALVMATAYPEVVARDVIEALGRVVEHRHLMVEGEGDLAAVAHLLIEADIVGAENLPTAFAQLEAEIEIDTIDEKLFGKASNGLPGLEAHHVASSDGVADVFSARREAGVLAP